MQHLDAENPCSREPQVTEQRPCDLALATRVYVVGVDQNVRVDERLPLVPLVARSFDPAAKMEPLVKKPERPPLRLLGGIVLANQRLDVLSEQSAD